MYTVRAGTLKGVSADAKGPDVEIAINGTRVSQVRDFRSRRIQSRGLITFAILHESLIWYKNNGLRMSDN